ncbi:uncharacterized protein LOC113357880 [Papaver somniferum]|uniref:uncharacterized protein LOC113357880 n=1 Tax=Papaver somniferum TaxID=3469 RepID=UPI000E6FAC05|nr:uncharacterized protein LOC113357880 [Papaver somniferum]
MQYKNHGGNIKVARYDNHEDGYGGNKRYYNQGANYRGMEVRMPPLNTTAEKVWEAVILMEEITPPPNLGKEPPSERRSKDFFAYHRFHGHTTNNCKNIQRIILRMIGQGKINHFLATPLPPPPPVQPTTGGSSSGADKEDFHDNVLSRVYARDAEGKEILNLAKIPKLKEWQKQPITFSAEEVTGGGEFHDSPLVVKLEIIPKENPNKEEGKEDLTWAINRILIDSGSSVDILFYHAYKAMGGRDEDFIPSTYKINGFNGTANKPKG